MKLLLSLLFCFFISTFIFAQTNTNLAAIDAANSLLESLNDSQRAKAVFAFDTSERFRFFYTPVPRQGLTLRDMDNAQKIKAINFLKASVSQQGSEKAIAIMQLESVLKVIEKLPADSDRRHPEKYYFSFFGKPDKLKPWAWRIEGHHLSLNFTSIDGKIASATPMFFGTNPARVPVGTIEEGKEILNQEAQLGLNFLASLSENQQKLAITSENAPYDMFSENKIKAKLDKVEGIRFGALNNEQQLKLIEIISFYVRNFYEGFGNEFMKKIEVAGFNNLYFNWKGSKTWGNGHYYSISNPVLLIEYDNTQNNANHVHSIVRDISNDFGFDFLKQHYNTNH